MTWSGWVRLRGHASSSSFPGPRALVPSSSQTPAETVHSESGAGGGSGRPGLNQLIRASPALRASEQDGAGSTGVQGLSAPAAAFLVTSVSEKCCVGSVCASHESYTCQTQVCGLGCAGGSKDTGWWRGAGEDLSRVTLGWVVETGLGPWLRSSFPWDPSVLSRLPTHAPPRRAALFPGLGSREIC